MSDTPEIMLYNTRTRRKERLDPVTLGKASMYVCGPTVYDRAHIGNARPVVVFDVLFRLLRHAYGAENVTYVRNITDVEDKINARARESGRSIGEITAETTRWYHEDMDALGALRPTFEPRATEYIGEMIAMIALLIARGHAYAPGDGHVLFAVGSYPEYGRLARRSLEDMRAGARAEVATSKRDPMDFVLWKPSDLDTPGWDSPWGRGRPGWHIECSAMARALLGAEFDVHGGGVDLAFPHHENELAQSACAHPDEGFARVWMHNGMLNIEGEKMSKSLGNFFTVRDLLDEYRRDFGIKSMGPAIRYRLLMGHYRAPLDASRSYIEEAASKLDTYRHFLHGWEKPSDPFERRRAVEASGVIHAIADDLNTPRAFAQIDSLLAEVRRPLPNGSIIQDGPSGFLAQDLLGCALDFLGFPLEALQNAQISASADIEEKIKSLLMQRVSARTVKDFVRADALRDGLVDAGVAVKDSAAGTEWELTSKFDPSKLKTLR